MMLYLDKKLTLIGQLEKFENHKLVIRYNCIENWNIYKQLIEGKEKETDFLW